MQLNIPYKIRAGIYIANGVIAPVMGYLLVRNIIGAQEMALYTAEVTFAFLLAGLNVTKNS